MMTVPSPSWACVCAHDVTQHDQGEHDAVGCNECDCPDFITEEDADDIVDAVYEWALADGETWATTAHEYRRHRAQNGSTSDGDR